MQVVLKIFLRAAQRPILLFQLLIVLCFVVWDKNFKSSIKQAWQLFAGMCAFMYKIIFCLNEELLVQNWSSAVHCLQHQVALKWNLIIKLKYWHFTGEAEWSLDRPDDTRISLRLADLRSCSATVFPCYFGQVACLCMFHFSRKSGHSQVQARTL